jgi:4-amino-4-deoxy-L-arabinose transferase-like glycosyltransferase
MREDRSLTAFLGVALTGAAVALALAWVAAADGRKSAFTDDEREYAQSAIHLVHHGVFSHASGPGRPALDAYREPLYPAFVAAVWLATGSAVPERPEGLLAGGPAGLEALRRVRIAQRLVLLLAALAVAWAVARMGGRPAAAGVAAAAVVTSPALRGAADALGSEALAAFLLTASAVALAEARRRSSPARILAAGLLLGATSMCRGAFLPLAPVAALVFLWTSREVAWSRRLAAGGLLLVSALAPAMVWVVRNKAVTGHAVLSDRGGLALHVRAELGADVRGDGMRRAAWAWTPAGWAERRARSGPAPPLVDTWHWSEGGERPNYFVRSLRERRRLVEVTGDPLTADRKMLRAAIQRILAEPQEYLVATPAVAWRSCFAEQSPHWGRPFDLAFFSGLALVFGLLVTGWRAVRARDVTAAAVVLPAVYCFVFHLLATEGLPRYQQPALPLLWAAAAAAALPGQRPSSPLSRLG